MVPFGLIEVFINYQVNYEDAVLDHSYLILEPCEPGPNKTCALRFEETRLDIWVNRFDNFKEAHDYRGCR